VSAALEFQTLAELCAEVDAMGPRKWLIRGIWPAGAYGAHAAEMKAQKSWNGFDLAVSVASGTPWLNTYEVDAPGPVIIFAGEGGKAAIVRRLRAICNGRGLKAEDLPIVVCARAPHLGNNAHLALFQEQTAHTKPSLVILDPLYLSAGGADGKDLYAMGALLEKAQHTCEAHDASLLVITHYNRKEGSGPMRMTGAGPAEWGRILIGAKVISRHTNIETLATTVVLELDVIGGEIPDQGIRVRRDIHADDPADLDSPLHYNVHVLTVEEAVGMAAAGNTDLPPAARKLLEALEALDQPSTSSELVDWIADKHGHGLKRETVSRNLNALERVGAVACTNPEKAVGDAKLWDLTASAISHQDTDFDDDSVVSSDENTPSVTSRDVTRDDHTVTDDVITCDPPIGVTRSRHTATVTPEQAEKNRVTVT
jgi:hypothetical protein